MKITIESTEQIVEVAMTGERGTCVVPARLWIGKTESGIEVQCLVTRIAVSKSDDCSQFDRELKETSAPTPDIQVFPLRMIL